MRKAILGVLCVASIAGTPVWADDMLGPAVRGINRSQFEVDKGVIRLCPSCTVPDYTGAAPTGWNVPYVAVNPNRSSDLGIPISPTTPIAPVVFPASVFMSKTRVGIFNDSDKKLSFFYIGDGQQGQAISVVMSAGEIRTIDIGQSPAIKIFTTDGSIDAGELSAGVLYRLGATEGKWVFSQLK